MDQRTIDSLALLLGAYQRLTILALIHGRIPLESTFPDQKPNPSFSEASNQPRSLRQMKRHQQFCCGRSGFLRSTIKMR